MQGNCRAKASDVPHEGAFAGREVDAWTVLIHDVPEASSSPLPHRKSACVVRFSLYGHALLDGGAAR